MRAISKIAPGWWDYTTLDREILDTAAHLTADDLLELSREGFTVKVYDTIEDFYLSEALEYITAWRQATEDKPAGVWSDRAYRAATTCSQTGQWTRNQP